MLLLQVLGKFCPITLPSFWKLLEILSTPHCVTSTTASVVTLPISFCVVFCPNFPLIKVLSGHEYGVQEHQSTQYPTYFL